MDCIGVFTSGGDSPGMNACLRAVVRTAVTKGVSVKGIYRGYQGMVDAEFCDLDARKVGNIMHRGGTILKSARSDDFRTEAGRSKAAENLKALGIQGLVAIGGDGTFTGAHVFFQEHGVPTVGVPGTIDNDLCGTDRTLGFDTAVNTVIEAVDKIRDTALSHDRLFFVEVMGRDSGFIAAHAAVATGAAAVILPERSMGVDELIARLEVGRDSGKQSSIVIVAEGKDRNAHELAAQVSERFDYYNARVTILGHVQRGGSPSAVDRILAARLGQAACQELLANSHGIMLGMRGEEVIKTPFAAAITDKLPLDRRLIALADQLNV